MYPFLTILEREVNNIGLIYVYREEESWYAYEQSALFLNKMLGKTEIEYFVVDGILSLIRTKVDINTISRTKVISYSKNEYVLCHSEDKECHEWLSHLTYEKVI